MNARRVALIALLVVGFAQMAGAVIEACGAARIGGAIKGVAAATAASPAPKVFSTAKGLETFSTMFIFAWDTPAGEVLMPMTPKLYAALRGPYNRRNAYGAVLAYGPVLEASDATRPMLESVLAYALGGDAPLLRELDIETRGRLGPMRVRYFLRDENDAPDLSREIECPRR